MLDKFNKFLREFPDKYLLIFVVSVWTFIWWFKPNEFSQNVVQTLIGALIGILIGRNLAPAHPPAQEINANTQGGDLSLNATPSPPEPSDTPESEMKEGENNDKEM